MTEPGLQIFDGAEIASLDVMRNGPTVYPPGYHDDVDMSLPVRGIQTRVVYLRESPSLSLLSIDVAPHAILPRHKHDTDCLYIVSEGAIIMGSRTIEAGGGFFVAADQPYSYQASEAGARVLEVRTAGQFATTIVETSSARRKFLVDNANSHSDDWEQYLSTVRR